ncbi:hypothetical protein AB0H83_46110 [Dactylosporangium sp. NPDC050688]|uniref:hypothetical protein n=1 Tax=Dactylosporangium sp. NPDC050688 TaxID=3157217 RepID=UPI0033EAB054
MRNVRGVPWYRTPTTNARPAGNPCFGVTTSSSPARVQVARRPLTGQVDARSWQRREK